MSMAMGHFAFGVGATTAVLMATGLDKKIKNTERIKFYGGVFAMIPDVGKLVPLLDFLHHSWWQNIFWLHGFLDKVDPQDTALMSSFFLAFMLLMLEIFWLRNRKSPA